MIEVEFKYPIDSLEPVRASVLGLGAILIRKTRQVDEYFNHDLQDFAKKDLALRIRRADGRCWLTFKGPKQDRSASNTAKMRVEVDLELTDKHAFEKMKAVLLGTGFSSAATVEKQRETFKLSREDGDIEICLDEVTDLGFFVELELLVEAGPGESAQHIAKEDLLEIATALGLSNPITTSYLELLQQS